MDNTTKVQGFLLLTPVALIVVLWAGSLFADIPDYFANMGLSQYEKCVKENTADKCLRQ